MNGYNENGTSFNLNITKREGDRSETTTVTTTSAEDIRRVINRFDTIDQGYDAEEGGCDAVNPEEYMPYGEGSLDVAMSNMADEEEPCCDGGGKARMVTIKRDGTLELDDDIQRMRHLSGIKEQKVRECSNPNCTCENCNGDCQCGESVNEDADFDYRDEGNGPNDATDYDYDNDIIAFARKGHSKKGNKITNMSGDNPLLDADEEGEEMYESMLADWEEFKKQPLNEDWGSSDTTAALNAMQDFIDRYHDGKQNPESITQAAENAGGFYAEHMGYTPEEAADWLVSLYVKRKMPGLEKLLGRPEGTEPARGEGPVIPMKAGHSLVKTPKLPVQRMSAGTSVLDDEGEI